MTTPITMENTVTDMQSEHIDTLKREIEIKERMILSLTSDVNIVGHILSELIEQQDVGFTEVNNILDDMTHERGFIIDVLTKHNIISEHWFIRDYEVTISVPVSLTMTVEATSADAAEEDALARLDWGRITDYDLDYSVYYDAEIMEVREV